MAAVAASLSLPPRAACSISPGICRRSSCNGYMCGSCTSCIFRLSGPLWQATGRFHIARAHSSFSLILSSKHLGQISWPSITWRHLPHLFILHLAHLPRPELELIAWPQDKIIDSNSSSITGPPDRRKPHTCHTSESSPRSECPTPPPPPYTPCIECIGLSFWIQRTLSCQLKIGCVSVIPLWLAFLTDLCQRDSQLLEFLRFCGNSIQKPV